MNYKEIREMTGLTQSAFCKKYGIPLKTWENWERNQGGGNIKHLIERAVREDLDGNAPPHVLGVGFRRILEISGLSQKEFAKKYGIKYTTIWNWYTGYSAPKPYTQKLLERFVREDAHK